jgi:TonB family protein
MRWGNRCDDVLISRYDDKQYVVNFELKLLLSVNRNLTMSVRTIILLIIVICNVCHSTSAQESSIDLRFEGGGDGLREFLSHTLKYPSKSLDNKTIGYSITGITITREGEIKEISTINPVDDSIDYEITIALLNTKGKWLKSNIISGDMTFYVQAIYQIVQFGEMPVVSTQLKDIYNFTEPVYITGIKLMKQGLPENNESIGIKISESLKNGNSEEALHYTSELIKRNPFKKELYQLRISINKKLNHPELIVKDADKLQNFIPEISLNEFLNTFLQVTAKNDSIEKSKLLLVEALPDSTKNKVEQMPQFPGGEKALMHFISNHLNYPVKAQEVGIQGTVIVNFVVQRDGKISRARIMSSPDPLLSAEALRVLGLMPKWTPGIQDGKTVLVSYTIPFKFMLNEANETIHIR